jgi:hypothetical protein
MARFHPNEILEGIMSLLETNLKATLGLQGIYRGNIAWLPPTAITSMVNGIWLNLEKEIDIEEVTLPKGLHMTYPVRVVYVRKIDTTSNPLDVKIDDLVSIVEMFYDNIKPNFSLSGGEILWMLPRTVEAEPAEDNYVSALSGDLMAVAVEVEIVTKTRIGS